MIFNEVYNWPLNKLKIFFLGNRDSTLGRTAYINRKLDYENILQHRYVIAFLNQAALLYEQAQLNRSSHKMIPEKKRMTASLSD